MRCPRCQETELSTAETMGGVAVDLCPSCSGLWLDRGELETLLGASTGMLVGAASSEGERSCPRCDLQWLRTLELPGRPPVVLDRCPDCFGFWLDPGEMERLRGRLAAERPVEPAAPAPSASRVTPPAEGADAPVSPAVLAILWTASLVIGAGPLALLARWQPGWWPTLAWQYPLYFASYVGLASILDPRFDASALFEWNRPGFDDRDWDRAMGWISILLFPGRVVAATLVATWRTVRA